MLKEPHVVAKYVFRRSSKEKKLYWGKKNKTSLISASNTKDTTS